MLRKKEVLKRKGRMRVGSGAVRSVQNGRPSVRREGSNQGESMLMFEGGVVGRAAVSVMADDADVPMAVSGGVTCWALHGSSIMSCGVGWPMG